MKRKLQIGVIGPEAKNMAKNNNTKTILIMAKGIGGLLAKQGVILITGGCSGVVEAACQGALENNGLTVGTPGRKRFSSNPFTVIEICTPIEIGDYLFAGTLSCDSIIVFPGDAGTLAEIAIAYRYKKPLIFIKGYGDDLLARLFTNFDNSYPLFVAENIEEAVNLAIEVAHRSLTKGGKDGKDPSS